MSGRGLSAQRRERRSGAAGGVSTGVATGALALLSAGTLATLGLVGAGEIAGNGAPGSLPVPQTARPPEAVVVTPAPGPSGGSDDGELPAQPVAGPLSGPVLPVLAPVLAPPAAGDGLDIPDGDPATAPAPDAPTTPAVEPAAGIDLSAAPQDDGTGAGADTPDAGQDGDTAKTDDRRKGRATGPRTPVRALKPAARRIADSAGSITLLASSVQPVHAVHRSTGTRPHRARPAQARPGGGAADVPPRLVVPPSQAGSVAIVSVAGPARTVGLATRIDSSIDTSRAAEGPGLVEGPGNGVGNAFGHLGR